MAKKSRLLLPLSVAALTAIATPAVSDAAVTGYLNQDTDQQTYYYSIDNLVNGYDQVLAGGDSALWSHFLANETVALEDDVNGIVDFQDVVEAYDNAIANGEAFDVDEYTSTDAAAATNVPAVVKEVKETNGEVVTEDKNIGEVDETLEVESVSAITNNDETVTISGTATGAEKVQVTVDSADAVDVTVENGSFSYTTTALSADEHTFSIVAVKGDQVSEASSGTVTVKNILPEALAVTVIDAKHIKVEFSEAVNNADDENNYYVAKISASGSENIVTLATVAADKKSAVLTLTSDLVPADYFIRFNDGGGTDIEDANTNVLAANSELLFKGTATADTTAPTVVTSSYDAVNNRLTVSFDENISTIVDRTKLSIGTVQLGVSETTTVSNNVLTVTLSPEKATAVEALEGAKTLTLAAGAVKDASNNVIESTSVAISDSPRLLSATYVEKTNKLTLKFNNVIDVSTVNIAQIQVGDNTLTSGQSTIDTTVDSDTLEVTVGGTDTATWEAIPTSNREVDILGSFGSDVSGAAVVASSDVDVTYEDDTIKPTLVSASYNATTDTLTLNFDEGVDEGTLTVDKIDIIDKDGFVDDLTGASVSPNTDKTTWEITGGGLPANVEAADVATLKVRIEADAADDLAGNALNTNATGVSVSYLDETPAILDTFFDSANGALQTGPKVFALQFNKELDVTTVEATDFTIHKDDNEAVTLTVSNVTMASDKRTVYITTETAPVAGYTYTIAWEGIKDSFGNTVKGDVDEASISASGTGPSLTSVEYIDTNSDYDVNAGDTFVLKYDQPIQFVGTPALGTDIRLFANDGSTAQDSKLGNAKLAKTGSDEVTITLGTTETLTVGNLDDGTTSVGYKFKSAATSKIQSLSGNNAVAGSAQLVSVPDTTVPLVESATYVDQNGDGQVSQGDYLYLNFDTELDTSVDLSGFDEATDVTLNGNDDTLGSSATAVFYDEDTIRITLGTTPDLDGADSSSHLYVDQAAETIDWAGGTTTITSRWGIDASSSTAVSVKSDDKTTPKVTAAIWDDVDSDGLVSALDTITLTFSEGIHENGSSAIAATDFYLTGGADLGSATYAVGGDNKSIVITAAGDTAVSVGITQINIKAGGTANIKDASGNNAQQAATSITITEE